MKLKILGRQLEIKTGVVVITTSILLLLGGLAGYILSRDDSDIIVESNTADPASAQTATNVTEGALQVQKAAAVSGTAVTAPLIKVYVVGCVNKPGIVTIEKGQMIDDAIRKAGGLTKDADADGINMVYALNENSMLCIKPSDNGAGAAGVKTGITAEVGKTGTTVETGKTGGNSKGIRQNAAKSAGTGVDSANSADEKSPAGKCVLLTADSGSGVDVINSSGEASEAVTTPVKTSAVNINTADSSELDTLPGVGEATARDIIAFREKNGPFRKIEDIMKVPRIKQNRFDNIRGLICVD